MSQYTRWMRTAFAIAFVLVASSADAAPIALPTFGLTLDAPTGAKVDANPHHEYVEILAKGFALQVRKASDVANTKVEDEEKSIKYSMQPTELTSEKLLDGFIVRYTTTTGDKKRYMLKGYRSIGGTGYTCETGADTRAVIDGAVAACKSLRR